MTPFAETNFVSTLSQGTVCSNPSRENKFDLLHFPTLISSKPISLILQQGWGLDGGKTVTLAPILAASLSRLASCSNSSDERFPKYCVMPFQYGFTLSNGHSGRTEKRPGLNDHRLNAVGHNATESRGLRLRRFAILAVLFVIWSWLRFFILFPERTVRRHVLVLFAALKARF